MRTSSPTASRAFGLLGAFVAVSMVSGLLLAGLALPAAWATGSATRGGVDFFNSLPDELAEPPLSEQSTVLDSKGRPIAHFYDERRITRPLSMIAPVMRQAIVSIEDSRFYSHGGVDPKGLLRAFVTNQVNDGRVQGASTLTQQYIKLRILEAAVTKGDKAGQVAALNKNYSRKLQEVRMAISLEKKKSKDEILTDYLNIANFGDSTYGVEAAAEYFFNGATAAQLTLPQAALLAGLVQSPESYNPIRHTDAALHRRNVVLARMLELGAITQQQHDAAVAAPLGVHPRPARSGCVSALYSAYFCAYVRNTIVNDPAFSALGKTADERLDTLKRNGLVIRTTLDSDLQELAYQALTDNVPVGDKSKVGAAAVTVEPGTGRVLTMVQNKEFYPGTSLSQTEINYNADYALGTSQGFQTGSTFKAFTLATWLAKGKGLYDSVDGTVRTWAMNDFTGCDGSLRGESWKPFNSEGGEGGSMSVMSATANSVNGAFVDMASQLSLCDIAATATKLGIHKAYAYDAGCEKGKMTTAVPSCTPSMVLGTLTIAPVTMAAAYAAFADDGMFCKPRVVDSIRGRDGSTISVPGNECSQAIDTNVARGVTFALKGVITNGTAQGKGIGRPAAGKTGTTDESVDTWFIGYTPQLSTAVWVGDNPNPAEGAKRKSINYRAIGKYPPQHYFGATIAAPIWQKFMKAAVDGLPVEDWQKPTGKVLSGSSIAVPDVTGQSVDQATSTLESAGFSVTLGEWVPSEIPSDRVATTSPAAGSRVSPKAQITIHPGDGSGGVNGNGQGGGVQNQPGGRVSFKPPIKLPGTKITVTGPATPKPTKSTKTNPAASRKAGA
jgi:membrane peptidoglycan carboxypeptidase